MLRNAMFAVALLTTPSMASAAHEIVNGGFEDPTVGNPCCTTTPPDPLPGWTVTSGNVNVVAGTFPNGSGNLAFEGNQYLDLVGQGGVGSLSQTINTIAGATYRLSFAYSHNSFSGPLTASASFAIGSLNGVVAHSTGNSSNLDWRTFSGSFVAGGPTSTLTFTNLTGGANEGIFLDAVNVAAVPEPATWLMMIFGFGALGAAMRRRRRDLALA